MTCFFKTPSQGYVLVALVTRQEQDSCGVSTGPLAVAASQNEEVEEPWSTYLPLWLALLQPDTPGNANARPGRTGSRKPPLPKFGLHASDSAPEELAAQQQALYDCLIRAIMDAVRNLDLEYHQADTAALPDAQDKLAGPTSSKVGDCSLQ